MKIKLTLLLILLTQSLPANVINQNADPVLKEACIKQFNKLPRGYFVLNAEESCDRFAKVSPTETISQCISEALGKSPNNRDYFLNYEPVAKFCEENPSFNPEQKKCMLRSLTTGGDAVAAFHKCDPKIIQCTAALEKHRPSGGKQIIKKLYHEFCLSYPDDRDMGQCIAEYASKHNSIAKNTKTLQNLCHEKSRGCVSSLKSVLPKPEKATVDQLNDIGSICYNAFYHERNNSWALCTFSNMVNERFSFRDAGNLCQIPQENTRECVIQYHRQGITYLQSTVVCRHLNLNTKTCLLKYFKNESPFHTSPLRNISEEIAEKFCSLEDEEERNCFIQTFPSPTVTVASLDATVQSCRSNSSSYKKCYEDFVDYFERNMILNTRKEDGRKICALSAPEMRLCMLNSIMKKEYVKAPSIFSKGNTWFPYDEYYNKCLSQFLGFLLQDLRSDNPWACRYQYFYSQNTWDKSWSCSIYNTERLCREFRQQLTSLSNTELQPECIRFNSKYYNNAETSYGNPLWTLCRERNLIPRN